MKSCISLGVPVIFSRGKVCAKDEKRKGESGQNVRKKRPEDVEEVGACSEWSQAGKRSGVGVSGQHSAQLGGCGAWPDVPTRDAFGPVGWSPPSDHCRHSCVKPAEA